MLYLAPFAISGLYAIYLWVNTGISAVLPSSVYLAVTRDPYVFLAGTVAVLVGLVIDESGVEGPARQGKVESLSSMLQAMAVASLVLSLVSALYANGFTGISGAANDFIVGRFSLVFPTMLVLLSYLITAKFGLNSLRNTKVLGVVAMLLVPVCIYGVGRSSVTLGVGGAFVLMIIGVVLLVMPWRKADTPKEA